MKADYPLITCICVTSNRIALLKKAIACFRTQDYPNKELLISYPKKDKLTKYVVDRIIRAKDLNIIQLERADEISLGDARNQAIAHASGDYVCTWDDDDWYHASRLSYQIQSIQNLGEDFPACVLNQLILYDQTSHQAYLSFLYPWENTLMCKKSIFLEHQYTSKDQGEDSSIIDFLDAKNWLCHIPNVPFLYIYIYHSGNTWGHSHFKSFIQRSQVLNEESLQSIQQVIA